LFFAEGYHRFAFLTANYKQPRKYLCPRIIKVNTDALGSELKQLSNEYDLDFTRLSNDEFVSLLKYSELPESKSYTKLENSIQALRAQNRNYNTQSKLTEFGEQIVKNFLHVLPEYCSFVRYLTDSESEEKGQNIPIKISPFQHLERQLATILGGKLLFAGSKIKFQQSNGVDLFFIVESSRKPAHQIMFEEKIMLRCADEVGRTNSSKQLMLQLGSKTNSKGILEVMEVSDDALREWVKSFVPEKLLNLAQNLVFLGFLMSNGVLEQMAFLNTKRNSIGK